MRERPYIGVTGMSTPKSATELSSSFRRLVSPEDKHYGVAGYLVSNSTIDGNNQRSEKYPSLKTLSLLLDLTAPNAENALHFRTSSPQTLADDVSQLIKRVGSPNIDMLQINVALPDPDQIESIKNKFPNLKIIMPLNRTLLSLPREEMVDILSAYDSDIDFILIDPSGGKGKEIDVEAVAPTFRMLRDSFPEKGIGFAGGFNPDNILRKLSSLVANLKTDDFSIDVEAGVRDGNEVDPHAGHFSSSKSAKYIGRASEFFN